MFWHNLVGKVQYPSKYSGYVLSYFVIFALYDKHAEADQRNSSRKAKRSSTLPVRPCGQCPATSTGSETSSVIRPQMMGDCESLWNSFFHWLDISDSPQRLHSVPFPPNWISQLVFERKMQCVICDLGTILLYILCMNARLQNVTTVLATYWSGNTEEAFSFTCHNIWWSCNKEQQSNCYWIKCKNKIMIFFNNNLLLFIKEQPPTQLYFL
jgi:hypothetical protein